LLHGNYTKTNKYLTKLRIDKNVRFKFERFLMDSMSIAPF